MDRHMPKGTSLFSNAATTIVGKTKFLTKKLVMLSCSLAVISPVFIPKEAQAWCGRTCTAVVAAYDNPSLWGKTEDVLDEHINDEFMELEDYILRMIWMENVLPALMLATEEMSAVAIQQVMAIGMFLDAETQMDSQRVLHEIQAQTHKDFRPSEGLCEFGTLSKSLANADIQGDTYAVIFSERSQDRQLGKGSSAGTYGHDLDQGNRILHFKQLFCNQMEREGALESVCDNTTSWSSGLFDDEENRWRMNKDIDYYLLVDKPWSLRIDFTNQTLVDTAAAPPIYDVDEEHILSMVANLFGHMTFVRPPSRLIKNNPSAQALSPVQKLYLDMRAVVAKRSVAENSLFSIASMKSFVPRPPAVYDFGPGTAIQEEARVEPYLYQLLKELGIGDTSGVGIGGVPLPGADDAAQLLGNSPSYYAQMEVLTKKAYQHPDFYTDLYDTPANVERKTVALQAVKLMQKFDMLKSHLRGEANVSILLELAVEQLQREVEDQIQDLAK